MKNRSTLLLAIVALSFLIVAGCSKNDSPAPKTNTDLVTQSTWKFSAATVGGADVSGFLDACQKDNILSFTAAGTGTVDEGTIKCDPVNDPQTYSFSWNFAQTETYIHVSATLFTGGSNEFHIITLSETQLVVSGDMTVSGITQTVTVTFTH